MIAAILHRANQAISVSDVSRTARSVFDRLATGEQDHYVVLKNNAPTAVILSVASYEAMLDELDDLRVDAQARARLDSVEVTTPVSHDEMMRRFGTL